MNNSLANVQCSAEQEFDRYRFPSKIPEFLVSESILLTTPFEIEFPLVDGENCVLVEDMNLESWIVCINNIVNMSRHERQEIFAKAGEQAREKLSWSSTVLTLHEALNMTTTSEGLMKYFKQDEMKWPF